MIFLRICYRLSDSQSNKGDACNVANPRTLQLPARLRVRKKCVNVCNEINPVFHYPCELHAQAPIESFARTSLAESLPSRRLGKTLAAGPSSSGG